MSKDIQEEINKQSEEVAGTYPEGKLNESDEGATTIGVGKENGKVVIRFSKPMEWVGFDAMGARALALALLRHGSELINEQHQQAH